MYRKTIDDLMTEKREKLVIDLRSEVDMVAHMVMW